MAKCKACGKEFKKKANKQSYCCVECKNVALKQQWRNASHKYYHRHKSKWGHNSVRRYGLGTGTLGPHADTNFKSEKQTVERELIRLRIK